MSYRDKPYLVTSKDLISLRTTPHETASPACTPRTKQPSYATVGTAPREACLTLSYVTNSTKRCDNNHAQYLAASPYVSKAEYVCTHRLGTTVVSCGP